MVQSVSDSAFNETIKNGICIVDFWAEWCGPCKMMAPVFEEVSKSFEGKASFFKMNVDDNQDIPGQMMIRGIPSLVAFKNGVKIDTKVGAMRKSDLEQWVTELLSK